jgi:hypothetical protein
MAYWLIIILAAAALLLATWFAGEWVCRRLAAQYAVRRRLWNGMVPDNGSDEDSGKRS